MNPISSLANLSFFMVEEYKFNKHYTFDASLCPRPHFCMALLTEGKAEFTDCSDNKKIPLSVGDIILVPIESTYISDWEGNPDISYISVHFIFDYPSLFSRQKNFKLQKITTTDFEKRKKDFEFMLKNFGSENDTSKFLVLSTFFSILSEILPQLNSVKSKAVDARIKASVEYIEKHFTENISIDTLASICNMSVSRFYPCFKKAMGVTPIEYINKHKINHAIILLAENTLNIEEISEKCGFESAAYFRRVFKKVTEKTPRDYKNTSFEI